MISLLTKWVLLMNKFWTVLSHTYISRFKTKSFLITTLLTIGIIFLIGNLPQIIDSFTNDEKKIAVIDEKEQYFTILSEGIEQDANDIELTEYTKSEKVAKKAVERSEERRVGKECRDRR